MALTVRPLYGGAMQCVLPSRFVDVRYKHATELTNNLHIHSHTLTLTLSL
jgi:hypothetical protein